MQQHLEENIMDHVNPSRPFNRILAAVDRSAHGIRAARMAGRLARALDARLTLLTVYAAPSGTRGEPNHTKALSEALDGARRVVERARRAVLEAGGPEPDTDWVDGVPWKRIISAAREGGYDLIVIGSRGRGRVRAALLGSVSNAVAAQAGGPVLVVGDER
jgi:nucleotide-binding universal stress UspA family protein